MTKKSKSKEFTIPAGASVIYVEAMKNGQVYMCLPSSYDSPWLTFDTKLGFKIAWLMFKYSILAKLGRGTRE
jgi:hypothetical protein